MKRESREAWRFMGFMFSFIGIAFLGAGILAIPIFLWGGWGAAVSIVAMLVFLWFVERDTARRYPR